MNWIAIETLVPAGEALVWAGGRYRIGVVVTSGEAGAEIAFFDPVSDALLPKPTHWCALPDPPRG